MRSTILALLALAMASPALAAEPWTQDDCHRALKPAAVEMQLARDALATCWGPAECALAFRWVELAKERHAAALAMCPAPVAPIPPKVTVADPFEPDVPLTPERAAWCAVMGCE
jgi:hypothetical protein